MIIAVKKGRTDIVRLLLDAKANPILQNKSGHTALSHAASEGHVEIVKLLLCLPKLGPTVEPNLLGAALFHAASAGCVDIVKLWLVASADVTFEVQRYNGRTAIAMAAKYGHEAVVPRRKVKGPRWILQ